MPNIEQVIQSQAKSFPTAKSVYPVQTISNQNHQIHRNQENAMPNNEQIIPSQAKSLPYSQSVKTSNDFQTKAPTSAKSLKSQRKLIANRT